jgi:hypothetical protein
MKWGIVDTQTGLWLGDDTGPKIFDSAAPAPDGSLLGERAYELARLAAELSDLRLEWPYGRSKPREVAEDPQPWHVRDTVPAELTTLEALELKARGMVW